MSPHRSRNRRYHPPTHAIMLTPQCWFDPLAQSIWRNDRLWPLTPIAFRILAYLVAHRGQVVTDQELVAVGWQGEDRDLADLYKQIHYLRGLIEEDPAHPRVLVTRRRAGYILV